MMGVLGPYGANWSPFGQQSPVVKLEFLTTGQTFMMGPDLTIFICKISGAPLCANLESIRG